MKIKPIILDTIQTQHTNYYVDIHVDSNVILITGDSGEGKSAVFSFLQELSTEDKRIKCFNYIDYNKRYKNSIKTSKGKLFVIDNADVLLDDSIRKYIATDTQNQYILIGRNPTGLFLTQDNIYELVSSNSNGKVRFSLKKAF
jgi:ABC-type lipoprotein export system ATPase subunit